MLKPGMNAWLRLTTKANRCSDSVKSADRQRHEQRVITVDNDGRFVPKRIEVFQQSGGVTAVSAGLQRRRKVVASGLFLIDSEANIAGALDRMRAQTPAAHAH
jgi:Cu(I)/Ag(I) efflux system membrane fusion protein